MYFKTRRLVICCFDSFLWTKKKIGDTERLAVNKFFASRIMQTRDEAKERKEMTTFFGVQCSYSEVGILFVLTDVVR